MRIKINGAVAAVVIVLIVCTFGTWLTLVLTNRIDAIVSLKWLGAFLATYGAGAATPLLSYWREKRITFEVSNGADSDPPKNGDNHAER